MKKQQETVPQARFVVGGVYRKPSPTAGAWVYGLLIRATQSTTGRLSGTMTNGIEVDCGVTDIDMQNWELIAEPGATVASSVPQRIATEDDLLAAVREEVAKAMEAVNKRVVELESANGRLRETVRLLEKAAQPPPEAAVNGTPVGEMKSLRERARA